MRSERVAKGRGGCDSGGPRKERGKACRADPGRGRDGMHRLGLSLIFTDALVGLRSSFHLLAQLSGSNQELLLESGECLQARGSCYLFD